MSEKIRNQEGKSLHYLKLIKMQTKESYQHLWDTTAKTLLKENFSVIFTYIKKKTDFPLYFMGFIGYLFFSECTS